MEYWEEWRSRRVKRSKSRRGRQV